MCALNTKQTFREKYCCSSLKLRDTDLVWNKNSSSQVTGMEIFNLPPYWMYSNNIDLNSKQIMQSWEKFYLNDNLMFDYLFKCWYLGTLIRLLVEREKQNYQMFFDINIFSLELRWRVFMSVSQPSVKHTVVQYNVLELIH